MTTCPYCTPTPDGKHAPACIMANRPIHDVAGSVALVAEHRWRSDVAIYQARIAELTAERDRALAGNVTLALELEAAETMNRILTAQLEVATTRLEALVSGGRVTGTERPL